MGRLLGFALLFVALRAALSLDEQRVPPEVLRPHGEPSGARRPGTGPSSPEALQPRGDWRRASGDLFAWQWSGPPIAWQVVLLDENLMELGRTGGDAGASGAATGGAEAAGAGTGSAGASGTRTATTTANGSTATMTAMVPVAWERHLQPGTSGYWMVEGVIEGEHGSRRVASAPVRFTVVR